MKKIILASLILSFFAACNPQLQENNHTPPVMLLSAKTHDVEIKDFADENFVNENLTVKQDLKSSLQQIENKFEISTQPLKKEWAQKATEQYQDLNAKMNQDAFDPTQSVYLNLVYDHIHDDVNSSVNQASKQISIDTEKILALIRSKEESLAQINTESTLVEKLNLTSDFFKQLSNEISQMKIMAEFKSVFKKELDQQSQNILSQTFALDESLVRAETLETGLNAIVQYVNSTHTELSALDQSNLAIGLRLTDSLKNLKDTATGLQALALVWSLLDDKQRTDYFQEASPDLYKFLVQKSADDIQCLCEKSCKGFKNTIILNIGVYPAIEKFGLSNIATLINTKGKQYLQQKVNRAAGEAIQKIGETLAQQILKTVSEKKSELNQFKDQLRENLSTGLLAEFAQLKQSPIKTFILDSSSATAELSLQTVNLRNKINLTHANSKTENLVGYQFEVLETLLRLPLFSQLPNSNQKTIQNDLVTVLNNPEPRQYLGSVQGTEKTVQLNQQTEMLLTTSLAIKELADWKTSNFDQGLSQIQAKQILSQFNSKSLSQSFFDKSQLLSLTVSLASQTLKLLQSDYSPLILVNNDNQIIPIQDFLNSKAGPLALAAATDITAKQRHEVVHAQDLGSFLLAVIQFYSATAGIEQTHAQALTAVNQSGTSRLSEIIEARSTLKKLIVAMANFISNQLLQKNGLVAESIMLNEKLKPSTVYDLRSQTRSIEALVRAYELTDIEVYLWTAQDIYFSMNRNLYSTKMKFYQMNTANQIQSSVDYNTLLETYRSLLKLKPYLNLTSQAQFEKIYSAWIQ